MKEQAGPAGELALTKVERQHIADNPQKQSLFKTVVDFSTEDPFNHQSKSDFNRELAKASSRSSSDTLDIKRLENCIKYMHLGA